jgi:hypothetical protein
MSGTLLDHYLDLGVRSRVQSDLVCSGAASRARIEMIAINQRIKEKIKERFKKVSFSGLARVACLKISVNTFGLIRMLKQTPKARPFFGSRRE